MAKFSQGHLRDNSRLDVEQSRRRMAVLSTEADFHTHISISVSLVNTPPPPPAPFFPLPLSTRSSPSHSGYFTSLSSFLPSSSLSPLHPPIALLTLTPLRSLTRTIALASPSLSSLTGISLLAPPSLTTPLSPLVSLTLPMILRLVMSKTLSEQRKTRDKKEGRK